LISARGSPDYAEGVNSVPHTLVPTSISAVLRTPKGREERENGERNRMGKERKRGVKDREMRPPRPIHIAGYATWDLRLQTPVRLTLRARRGVPPPSEVRVRVGDLQKLQCTVVTVVHLRLATSNKNMFGGRQVATQRGGIPAFYRNGPEFIAHIVVFSNMAEKMLPNYDQKQDDGSEKVKIICLGDSAVGKSK